MREPSQSQARQSERVILALAALMLPTLSLIPLGGLYLWKEGYLLWWAGAALVTVSAITIAERRLFGRRHPGATRPDGMAAASNDADPAAGSVEQRAWRSVRAIERTIDPDKLDSTEALGALAARIVKAVADQYHPQAKDAVWRFTVPQALAISEQVARRLRQTVHETVPFGDRLTLAQVLAAYRFRGAINVAEKAYDVWRVVRLMNPATAVANEARERLSKAALNWGREHVTRRLAGAYVEEVGRAAIDLYSGRLGVAMDGAGEAEAGATGAESIEPAKPVEAIKKPSPLKASWSLARFLARRKRADDTPPS